MPSHLMPAVAPGMLGIDRLERTHAVYCNI